MLKLTKSPGWFATGVSFVLIGLLIVGRLFQAPPEGPRLLPARELAFELDSEFPLLDHFVFEFQEDLYFFRAYFTNSNEPGVQARLPLRVGRLKKHSAKIEFVQDLFGVEHVRHARQVTTPWGEGVVVVDHGFDHLSHGGRLRLFIFDPVFERFVDHSSKLPFQDRVFAFNVSPVRNEAQLDDLLISIVNTEGSHPLYFHASGEGYEDQSNRLPEEWLKQYFCFMTSHEIEVESGERAVYLGACDRGPHTQNSIHDRVMVWRDERWVFLNEDYVPVRDHDKTWGTVSILRAPLTGHPLQDIGILTHDYGFTVGNIRLFKRDDLGFSTLKIEDFPNKKIRAPGKHYFHHLQAFDLNRDGLLDLVGSIRYLDRTTTGFLKTDFALLNTEKGFQYVQHGLTHPIRTEVISVHQVHFEDLSTLVVFYHDGRVNLYR